MGRGSQQRRAGQAGAAETPSSAVLQPRKPGDEVELPTELGEPAAEGSPPEPLAEALSEEGEAPSTEASASEEAPSVLGVLGFGDLVSATLIGDGSGITLPDAEVGPDGVTSNELRTFPGVGELAERLEEDLEGLASVADTLTSLSPEQRSELNELATTLQAKEEPPPPPAPIDPSVSRYKVWPHGELHHNGRVHKPGDEVELPTELGDTLGCLEKLI